MSSENLFNVLIVDDTAANLKLLAEVLGNVYSISLANGGARALEIVKSSSPDLILLDIVMPDLDGYEVCRRLKAAARTREIPVIFLTGIGDSDSKAKGFELGAVDYITKPFDIQEVRARVNTHLSLKRAQELLADQNATLERMVDERTRELSITQEVTIESLSILAETRDSETGGHIRRTQRYVRIFAEHLSTYPHYRDALLRAESALGTNSFLRFAGEIAYSHHERWDGGGYPQGLREEQIPVPARIMALADVYDALISKRLYKPPLPHRQAIRLLLEEIGSHFDPKFGDLVRKVQRAMWEIAREFADTQEEREALGEP